MSDQQTDSGHTQIGNALLEWVYQHSFTGSEFRVLLFVIRSSEEHRKHSFILDCEFIVKETGLSKRSVVRAVTRLVAKNVLNTGCLADSGEAPGRVLLNPDFRQWITDASFSDDAGTGELACAAVKSGQPSVENQAAGNQKNSAPALKKKTTRAGKIH